MCTVTFIPVGNRVFITSNRDEKSNRLPAEPPLVHEVCGASLLLPKDGEKGGTWICANKRGDCGVLLNGAKEAHVPKLSYRHSRGIILPQLLSANDPLEAFSKFDASELEPFTLVLFVHKQLYECIWDGQQKYTLKLAADQPHIWSSSTLYTASMKQERKDWFAQWISKTSTPNTDSILALHNFGGKGDKQVDYVMNRSGQILTVSITMIELSAQSAAMTYHSIVGQKRYRNQLSFVPSANEKRLLWWRRFYIRLRHWEYWPFSIVYAPIYPYWLWLCLRAKSFFFFNAANPSIRNGGFLWRAKKKFMTCCLREAIRTRCL